jgi:DNA-binding LacI/PurR family transcriptional regulator
LKAHGGLPARVAHGSGQEESLLAIVRGWLEEPELPDAIFAVNDTVALLVMQTLRERGVQIPGEIALVGFDDHYVATYVSPPLTTVRQPFGALGEAAAHLLLDRMTGRYTGAPKRVLLPTQLVVRRSCGSHGLSSQEPTTHQVLKEDVAVW